MAEEEIKKPKKPIDPNSAKFKLARKIAGGICKCD